MRTVWSEAADRRCGVYRSQRWHTWNFAHLNRMNNTGWAMSQARQRCEIIVGIHLRWHTHTHVNDYEFPFWRAPVNTRGGLLDLRDKVPSPLYATHSTVYNGLISNRLLCLDFKDITLCLRTNIISYRETATIRHAACVCNIVMVDRSRHNVGGDALYRMRWRARDETAAGYRCI